MTAVNYTVSIEANLTKSLMTAVNYTVSIEPNLTKS